MRISDKQRLSEIYDTDVVKLHYQAENALLLANLAIDTKLGISQAKKIVTYDFIKSLLTNSSTPYMQKRAFLKCLYQV